jgi:predicted GIY-YIG superfamily endonuclease
MVTKEFIKDVFYVYCIIDENNDVIYIGYTSDPKRRFNEHMRFSSNKDLRIYLINWNKVQFRIIAEFFDKDLAIEYEDFLIKKHGKSLLNKVGNDRI